MLIPRFFRSRRRSSDPSGSGFPEAWRTIIEGRVRQWVYLSADERTRLEALALDLIADKDWEAAQGFELTDEIIVTIAAQAALLTLELPGDSYRNVGTILVHPSHMMLEGEHSAAPGVMSNSRTAIDGQAVYGGPVVIAWDTARYEARHPGRGANVVFHEFAHKLDMLDGTVDGTPPLGDPAALERWIEVCTRIFRAVEIGEGGHALRAYAGVNAGEFFAVSTEVFFDNPHDLRHEHPDLYDCLRDFYRQDPAARLPA
jgi:Mlc titration factor MtfA (ptsG expression regulator)